MLILAMMSATKSTSHCTPCRSTDHLEPGPLDMSTKSLTTGALGTSLPDPPSHWQPGPLAMSTKHFPAGAQSHVQPGLRHQHTITTIKLDLASPSTSISSSDSFVSSFVSVLGSTVEILDLDVLLHLTPPECLPIGSSDQFLAIARSAAWALAGLRLLPFSQGRAQAPGYSDFPLWPNTLFSISPGTLPTASLP